MLNMFSGEHESDASSTTSEVPELPHTPRGINDRPLLQLYTTVSSRSDHPTSQVSMATSLPSSITPTAQGSSSAGYGGTLPVQVYPYDPYHSNLPYPVIFYPLPTLLPPRFQVSEDEYEFLRGRSGSAEDSLLAGLSGPISNYDLSDRLLVVLHCLRCLQFGSRHKDHDQVVQTISAFFRQCSRPGTHPVDIIDKIFNNAASELYDSATKRPLPYLFPELPHYACGPESRYKPGPVLPSHTLSTRNTILQWSLLTMLKELDHEREGLRTGDGKFVLDDDSCQSWDRLLSWKTAEKEGIIAQQVGEHLIRIRAICSLCVSRLPRPLPCYAP